MLGGHRAVEAKIEEKLVKAVKKAGGLCLKLVSPGYVGVPDRIVMFPFGKIGFVEVKAHKKKPRKIQLQRHKELRSLGFNTYVIDNEKQIQKLIEIIGGPVAYVNKFDYFFGEFPRGYRPVIIDGNDKESKDIESMLGGDY